jgi:EF hand
MKPRLPPLSCLIFSAALSYAAVPGADILGGLIARQFDSNSDGILDTGEWQSGIAASFDEMDANGDGSISGDDVDALKKSISDETGDLGATVAVALIKQIVMTLDKNSDMLVSKTEFADGAEGIFKKLDANKDAQVSKEELAELPTRLLK